MSRVEKLEIIENSQVRRNNAFQIVIDKREAKANKSKAKKTSTRSKRVSKSPSTPEGLMALMNQMSAEERENLLMALKTNL